MIQIEVTETELRFLQYLLHEQRKDVQGFFLLGGSKDRNAADILTGTDNLMTTLNTAVAQCEPPKPQPRRRRA